jgi:hypothetical protein
MWYRICWRSPVNGDVQRGRPLYASADLAEEVAQMMNALWPDTDHWVESTGETVAADAVEACAVVRF